MDSTKIDNELIIETGKCEPIKMVLVGDGSFAAELESACAKLADRVKAATSEKSVFVRWNKRTGVYELIDKQDLFKSPDE